MLKTNKSQMPLVMTIAILLTFTIILISTMFVLYNLKQISIDDRKIDSQIVIKKLLRGNCFSSNYGEIDISLFTQENFDSCLMGIENIEVVLEVSKKEEDKTKLLKRLYFEEDELNFNKKSALCSKKSSILCNDLKYPILLKSQNSEDIGVLRIILVKY